MADKLFTLGRDTNTIYGYKMDAPDDLSTIVYDYGNSLHVDYSNIETLVGGNVKNATYDNVRFSVNTQDIAPRDITFNNDGTKMYMVGYGSDSVHQYSLATAFDVSTCSYDNVSFSVADQDTTPRDITFNNDGTKMYMAGDVNNSVYQYSLATAFDVSTCSYDNVSFSVADQDTTPQGITFNNDGTKMYMVGDVNNSVYQYSLATAFDISTCSYDSVSFSVVYQDSYPQGIAFNNDGTKMYMVGNGRNSVYQYSLATAFDISTCSYDNVRVIVSSQDIYPYGFTFNNDGTKMYILGGDTEYVYQYSVNGSINSTYDAVVEESSPVTFTFNETGTKLYVYGETLNRIYQYNLSTSYNLSSATYNTYFDCSSFYGNSITEIVFKNDGTDNRLFVLTDTRRVYSTPFASGDDLPLGTIGPSFNASTQITISGGALEVNNGGTRFYITNINNNTVYEYSMSTPYSMSGASYTGRSFNLGSRDAAVRGIDGIGGKLFMLGNNTDTVYQYSVSIDASGGYVADVSSLALESIPTVAHKVDDIPTTEVAFGDTGRALILDHEIVDVQSATNTQMVYNDHSDRVPDVGDLFTFYHSGEGGGGGAEPADISGASYDNVRFSFGSPDSTPSGITFNNAGTKMYIIGEDSDSVYQYSLATAFDILTCSYDNVSFSVASQNTRPRGITFSNDGTKMYMVGDDVNYSVYQYSLATAFELSTCSYDNVSFSVESQDANPRGITFSNDGTKMYIIGLAGGGRIHQYSLATAFDISTCSYDNVRFSVNTQDTSPSGIEFNNDGTKMYMLGYASDSVHQYSLATEFDLSTCSYDGVSFSVNAQDGSPRNIAFNNDGTKMYIIGIGRIHQYSLATAFDLSTCSYDNVSFGRQDGMPYGITFNNAGTKMYMVGNASKSVYQYSLATAFDLSTCSYDNVSFSIGSQDTSPSGIEFNNDGTKMYIIGTTGGSVYQYSLATAFDLSTCSYDGVSFSIGSQDGMPFDIAFNNDGTKMYMAGLSSGSVYQYSLATAFDLSTCSYDNVSFSVASQDSTSSGIAFSNDGTKMYMLGYTSGSVYQYSLATAFDISTCSYDNVSFSVNTQDTGPSGIEFNNDGTKMYMLGDSSKSVYQYSVSTFVSTFSGLNSATINSENQALDSVNAVHIAASPISGATYDNVSFLVYAQDGLPFDIAFNSDGTKMYMAGYKTGSVHQYSLATAFDISTCSYDSVSFSVNAQDSTPSGITFNNAGTKMYMVGNSSDSVYQYSLATAFDLSTCSYDNVSFSVNAQDLTPTGLAFNNDGTKMYMVGYANSSVHQYSLATAFELSTCSYDNVSFSVGYQDVSPTSIAFNNDGKKMYMVGDADSVYQYSLATAFDLSTCSYDNVRFSVGSQDRSPTGITFSNDGTKMYMVGIGSYNVHQYSVNGSINNITRYTVTYPAISQAPDTTYGYPLMKARRTSLTPAQYTLSSGDVVVTYEKIQQEGRELAFRHTAKHVDDMIKVTRFDLEKLS